jgi:hypothetical protein
MTRQNINIGTNANDGTGDTLRQSGTKINQNFVEIYQRFGGDSDILMPGIQFDSNGIIFEGSSVDNFETRLVVEDPTADRTVTIPNYTGEIIVDSATQTMANKTISDAKLIHPDIADSAGATYFYSFIPIDASLMSKNININLPSLSDSDTLVTNTSVSTMSGKTLTAPTIIAPTIGSRIDDSNGAQLIKLTATTSAINEITIANAAASSGPNISSTGTDTNINLNLTAKGTGAVRPSKMALNHAVQTANGAVSTSRSFIIFSKSTALAATLADGTVTGEMKVMINQNSGLATVTPANFAQGTSFSIAQYGATQIIWSGNDWYMIADTSDSYITIT